VKNLKELILRFHEDAEEIIEGYNQLPESVQKFIGEHVVQELNQMVGRAESCHSPIEQLLGLALEERMDKSLPRRTEDHFMHSQEVIKVGEKEYRVDFFLAVKHKGEYKGFIVECDGHDFHERTKEQAKKDKQRDRDLTKAGFTVIRFTGSEIYESPFVCAFEVVNIIINSLKKG
jgi:very-short-patch-repair endonuclease